MQIVIVLSLYNFFYILFLDLVRTSSAIWNRKSNGKHFYLSYDFQEPTFNNLSLHLRFAVAFWYFFKSGLRTLFPLIIFSSRIADMQYYTLNLYFEWMLNFNKAFSPQIYLGNEIFFTPSFNVLTYWTTKADFLFSFKVPWIRLL